MELYSCEEFVKVLDVLEWKYAELVLCPNITLMEREVHPCFEHKNYKTEKMMFSVEVSMEPKNRAVRTCHALGGLMEVPENNSDVKALVEMLNHTNECRSVWILIYKMDSENWLDVNNQAVNYLPWTRGQLVLKCSFRKKKVG